MIDTQSQAEIDTFSMEVLKRERWLRYDVQTSLREIRDMINQMPMSQQKIHALQRVDGLLLRSVRVE